MVKVQYHISHFATLQPSCHSLFFFGKLVSNISWKLFWFFLSVSRIFCLNFKAETYWLVFSQKNEMVVDIFETPQWRSMVSHFGHGHVVDSNTETRLVFTNYQNLSILSVRLIVVSIFEFTSKYRMRYFLFYSLIIYIFILASKVFLQTRQVIPKN